MVDLAAVISCLVLGADPQLISAVIEVESGWSQTALNVNKWDGKNYESGDVRKTAAAADVFIKNGYTVDVGLMQINSVNLKKYEVDTVASFDICTNVQLGEKILINAIEYAVNSGLDGDDAIRAGLSIYNTGDMKKGIKNGYTDKVWSRYQSSEAYASYVSDTKIEFDNQNGYFDYSANLIVEYSTDE